MINEQTKSPEHAQKLTAGIKKAYPQLSDADIALQASNPAKFLETVTTKCNVSKDEAEKTIKKLDAECAASCAANSNKPAEKVAGQGNVSGQPEKSSGQPEKASAPLPKAANS